MSNWPDYLSLPAERLGSGHSVHIRVVEGMEAVGAACAEDMAQALREGLATHRPVTWIVPVGPVDQYPLLAEIINQERLSLRDAVLINMDEYLDEDDRWIPETHPLSFRGYMQRRFYDLLDPELAPPPEQRVFPDPENLAAIGRLIDERGGVDLCFGGIGINGHVAFNEPARPDDAIDVDAFADLPTRLLDLACETRTINANTVGGSLEVIPRRCVTVGMREILSARALKFYCNRPWQAAVVRRVLHGPITAECPASYLRRHTDATLTVADYVAAAPEIRLR